MIDMYVNEIGLIAADASSLESRNGKPKFPPRVTRTKQKRSTHSKVVQEGGRLSHHIRIERDFRVQGEKGVYPMLRALGVDGRGYVLADRSCKLSPAGWARQAVDLFV
jgi:hypothetical protein